MSAWNEERCRPSTPRPGRAVCDWCDEDFGADDDLRIPYNHWRCGSITICETCNEKFHEDEAIETAREAG